MPLFNREDVSQHQVCVFATGRSIGKRMLIKINQGHHQRFRVDDLAGGIRNQGQYMLGIQLRHQLLAKMQQAGKDLMSKIWDGGLGRAVPSAMTWPDESVGDEAIRT